MEASAAAAPENRPVVCLGEALVDLICPDPVEDPERALRFEVHFGGALANVAVAARRAGAPASLAGACGNDAWGRLLRRRLLDEGVGLNHYRLVDGLETPFAFATLDESREPSFRIFGDAIEEGIATLTGNVGEIVAGAGALAFGSNTLLGQRAHGVTMATAAAARELGVPLLFDPNLRPGRWDDLDRARELCLELAAQAAVLKCNIGEARWLSDRPDADAAETAEALVQLGPKLVVVTAGTAPAVARGSCAAAVGPPQVEMISPLGAGDVFMGTLAAGLLGNGWRLDDVEGPLERAAAAAAEACTRLGAFD